MLFVLFAPAESDRKAFDIDIPEWYYDKEPRTDEQIVAHLRAALLEVTKGWTLDDLKARLALMKLEEYPDDELQVMFLRDRIWSLENASV